MVKMAAWCSYDLRKDTDAGFELKGILSTSPLQLQTVIVRMQLDHRSQDNQIDNNISVLIKKSDVSMCINGHQSVRTFISGNLLALY